MNKNLTKLIKQVAEKHDISYIKAEAIVMSEFHLMKRTVAEEGYKSAQLIHWGKIQVSEKRKNNYLNKKNKDE